MRDVFYRVRSGGLKILILNNGGLQIRRDGRGITNPGRVAKKQGWDGQHEKHWPYFRRLPYHNRR